MSIWKRVHFTIYIFMTLNFNYSCDYGRTTLFYVCDVMLVSSVASHQWNHLIVAFRIKWVMFLGCVWISSKKHYILSALLHSDNSCVPKNPYCNTLCEVCYEPADNCSTVGIAQIRNCSRRTLLSVLQSRVGNVQCSVCTGACGLQAPTSVTLVPYTPGPGPTLATCR